MRAFTNLLRENPTLAWGLPLLAVFVVVLIKMAGLVASLQTGGAL